MSRGSGIRGSRIGSGPSGHSERGPAAERTSITFWCGAGHSTPVIFALSADLPQTWDCHHCALPAGLDPESPPATGAVAPFKTHLQYVRDRRSATEAEDILTEALAKLRAAS
ncbi:RNA polymerase-binding protein RbpA [Catenulispora subtropica]|uniref:RNA polymerase-binding protein RbpA n=1 Tax=Catenulispora subtropica TaxID=450798 RepID=A0ABP5CZH3_9ACTN